MLLTIDTSGPDCAVCVFDPQTSATVVEMCETLNIGHAERLVPMVGECLVAASMEFANLKGVAATVGPGSFTGLRVGLSCARAVALACAIPACGVGVMEAMAASTSQAVTVAMDARRGEVWFAAFDAQSPNEPHNRVCLVTPRALTFDEAALEAKRLGHPLVGSGAALLADASGDVPILSQAPCPSVVDVARLAAHALAHNTGSPLSPLYIRGADAKPQASVVAPSKKVAANSVPNAAGAGL